MNNYEKNFENIQDCAVIIGELIEELIRIEEVLTEHRTHESKGIQYEHLLKEGIY